MCDNTTTFTLQDQQLLGQLVEKYAGGRDVRHVKHARQELQSTRRKASHAKDAEGKAAVMRDFFASHPQADERDRDAIRELSHKLHVKAQRAWCSSKGALDAAMDAGFITAKEHATKLRDEQRRVLLEGQRTARQLMIYLAELASSATFEATASDADRRRAMEGFDLDSQWERTKADFKRMYDAASVQRKVEMKLDHPELFSAVFGR